MTDSTYIEEDRPLKSALWNGWRRTCPSCGKGPLLRKYLKVRDACSECGEDFHHHRADDGPAYLVILIVGHILAFLIHFVWTQFRPDPLVMATIISIGAIALSLYLLPRMKGLVVGIQWARRMHGFANAAG
mgnify:CR=1 FL=1